MRLAQEADRDSQVADITAAIPRGLTRYAHTYNRIRIPRISLYVPEDASEELNALRSQLGNRSLSQFFIEQVRAALAGLEKNRMEGTELNRDQVIRRLRATKSAEQQAASRLGRAHGRRWAKSDATAMELEEVARFDLIGSPGDEGFFGLLCQRHPTIRELMSELRKDGDLPLVESYDEEFVSGFVHGARDIWIEVADEL